MLLAGKQGAGDRLRRRGQGLRTVAASGRHDREASPRSIRSARCRPAWTVTKWCRPIGTASTPAAGAASNHALLGETDLIVTATGNVNVCDRTCCCAEERRGGLQHRPLRQRDRHRLHARQLGVGRGQAAGAQGLPRPRQRTTTCCCSPKAGWSTWAMPPATRRASWTAPSPTRCWRRCYLYEPPPTGAAESGFLFGDLWCRRLYPRRHPQCCRGHPQGRLERGAALVIRWLQRGRNHRAAERLQGHGHFSSCSSARRHSVWHRCHQQLLLRQ
jgi:hypothetical protein